MSSAGALIERFRNQRPTSRAERNYLKTEGQAPPLWWKKENQDRETFDPDAPALRDPKSLYTKTAPITRTKYTKEEYSPQADRRKHQKPVESSIDDLVFGDIFEHQRTYEQTNYDEEGSPRPSDYSVESIERTTETRTRFRFAPTLTSSRDLYGMPYRSTLMDSKFRTSGGKPVSDSHMMGRSSLVAVEDENDMNASNHSNSDQHNVYSSHHCASDIGVMLEDTLAKLNEKLAEDGEGGGGGFSPSRLESFNYTSYRNYDDEDLPASISAVREELEANLMCFNLLFESKFKREDEAEEEAKSKAAEAREEIVKEVAAEQAMSRLFEPLEEYIDREPMSSRQHQYHQRRSGHEMKYEGSDVYEVSGREYGREVDRGSRVDREVKLDVFDHVTDDADDGNDGSTVINEGDVEGGEEKKRVVVEQPVRQSIVQYDARFKENECHFVRVSRSSVVPLQAPPPSNYYHTSSSYQQQYSPQQTFTLAATSRGLCNELDEVMGRLNKKFETPQTDTEEAAAATAATAPVEEKDGDEAVVLKKTQAQLEHEAALAVFEAALDEEDARVHWRSELSDMRRGWAVYQTQDKEELEVLKSFRDSLKFDFPRESAGMSPRMNGVGVSKEVSEYGGYKGGSPSHKLFHPSVGSQPYPIPTGFVHTPSVPPPPTPPHPEEYHKSFPSHRHSETSPVDRIPPTTSTPPRRTTTANIPSSHRTAAAEEEAYEETRKEGLDTAKERLERFKEIRRLYDGKDTLTPSDYLLTASPKVDPKERLKQLKAQRANVSIDLHGR